MRLPSCQKRNLDWISLNWYLSLWPISDNIHDISKKLNWWASILTCDYKQAYDQLSIDYLRAVLVCYGLHGKSRDLLVNFFINRHKRIKTNSRFLPKFTVKNGIPQRNPLLLLIFSLLISPLLHKLQQSSGPTFTYMKKLRSKTLFSFVSITLKSTTWNHMFSAKEGGQLLQILEIQIFSLGLYWIIQNLCGYYDSISGVVL